MDNEMMKMDSIDEQESVEQAITSAQGFKPTVPSNKLDAIEQAFIYKYASIWALIYKTIKGHKTTFISSSNKYKHRPWQQQILDDQHPNKVIEKSRQLGMSEVGMTEVLHFLITRERTKAMYIFPRNQQMADFSKSRIKPVIQSSAYFQSIVDPLMDSVSTKKLNDSWLFMRSGWGGALGEGTDIDFLAIDEYDRMKDGVELSFQEGLSASNYGLMRRWSTPTVPGRGVNGIIAKSDQMRYIWTCEHCGTKQFLTFDDNVIQVDPHGVNMSTQEVADGTFIVGCKKCKQPINRMGVGEWVATHPSVKETRGYHISQLDAAWISADDIMRRRFNYSSKQLFFNYVIGEPFASEGIRIYEEDIRAAIRLPREEVSRTLAYAAIVAGIDWGDTSYMAVLGIKSNGAVDLLNLYSVQDDSKTPLRSVSYFCAILRAYTPNLVVADAGYGADRNTYAYTQFPTSWYACRWTTVKAAPTATRFIDQWNDSSREVTVDKTLAVQRVLHSFKGRLIGLFPWNEKLATLTQHLKNTIIMDEEEDGIVYQRATRTGADHFCSAIAYGLIAVNKLTNYNISVNTRMPVEFI